MSKIFEVRQPHERDNTGHGRQGFVARGHYFTREEAERGLEDTQETMRQLKAKYAPDEPDDYKYYRSDNLYIEEIDTTGMFEIPSRPTPREKYSYATEPVENAPGTWNSLKVTVSRDLKGDDSFAIDSWPVGTYVRNYFTMYQTFEPFRQGDKEYALIAPDYTGTSVMDLSTGEIIAAEERSAGGFCPVGFYVPDWWDVHDGSILPGTSYWDESDEWPNGEFGFVWGCYWGDDTSWKIQYLDLSRISEGIITRDDRFGYVELATHPLLKPQDFINVYTESKTIELNVVQRFNLQTGKVYSYE